MDQSITNKGTLILENDTVHHLTQSPRKNFSNDFVVSPNERYRKEVVQRNNLLLFMDADDKRRIGSTYNFSISMKFLQHSEQIDFDSCYE